MTDTLQIAVRLNADGSGLVGQLKLTREEMDKLCGSAGSAGAGLGGASEEGKKFAGQLSKMKEWLDPVGAGMAKVNQHLVTARAAFDAGKISAEQLAAAERKVAEAAKEAEDALRRGNVTAGQVRAGTANLGRQFQDISQQLSGGQSPFMVFNQQAGQTFDAMSQLGGKVGEFGKYLAGPFGSIMIAAVSVAGSYAASLIAAGEASDKAAAAERKHGQAARNLKEALDDLEEATGKVKKSEDEAIQAALNAAAALYKKEMATRANTKALLENAIAEEQVLKIRAQAPGERGDVAALGLDIATRRVQALQNALASSEAQIPARPSGLS